jgi:hypothetical protein
MGFSDCCMYYLFVIIAASRPLYYLLISELRRFESEFLKTYGKNSLEDSPITYKRIWGAVSFSGNSLYSCYNKSKLKYALNHEAGSMDVERVFDCLVAETFYYNVIDYAILRLTFDIARILRQK